MNWIITTDNENKIIEITTEGIADKEGSMEMAKIIVETMRHHRFTKAIIDHRNISSISGNVMDIYERPKLFRLIGMLLGIKLAAIINPAHAEHFKFLETVSLNQGYRYSVFYDKPSAMNWLLGKI
jgi:hypothetical protein